MKSSQVDDILKENTPQLRMFVLGRVGNRDDADDIVQDTLYQFWRTISVLDNPIAHVSSWLYTVAHNLIVNHSKKHREVSFADDGDDDAFMSDLSEIMAADDSSNPDILMLRSMVWDELDKALSLLPPEQREAVVLTELKGMSVKEAASIEGVPLNTFLSRKHYAMRFVRKRLQVLYNELMNK